MAMTVCAECGGAVSTRALVCPHCGNTPGQRGDICMTCAHVNKQPYAPCARGGMPLMDDKACPAWENKPIDFKPVKHKPIPKK